MALLAGVLLGLGAVPAGAGTGNYPSPLYLAGPPSALPSMSGSYGLLGNLRAAPVATSLGAGAGPAAGTYKYLYTVVDGAGETASLSSANVVSTGTTIQISNLPTGGETIRIYRLNATTPAVAYDRLVELAGNVSATWNDVGAAVVGTLPKAENRVQSAQFAALCTATTPCTGYFDFQPGVVLGASTNNDDILPFPPAAPTKRGFVVEGAGSVHIPAGTWTFNVQTRSFNPNGVARLVVGMWKVDDSGNVVGSPILASEENTTTNLVTAALSLQTVTVTASVGDVSLAEDEHLYVQFWRRQTTQYSSGGALNRSATMYFLDGVARVEHPGAVADPTLPTQTAPAASASTTAWPQLTARYDDPVAADTGTLQFQVCSDAACATVLETLSSASGIAAGATASVTPAARPLGTYYWRVRGEDSGGAVSTWSATRSFTYAAAAVSPAAPAAVADTTPPSAPSLASPSAGATLSALPTFQVGLTGAAGDASTVEVRVCTTGAPSGSECAGLATSGLMTVSGSSAVFAAPLGDGDYHWQARAVDPAGNASAWTATSSFTYDATAPGAPVLESPAAGGRTSSSPTLSARFDSADGKGGTVEFQICRSAAAAGTQCADAAGGGSATVGISGATATYAAHGLTGTYHWQARSSDAAGNVSAWSATRSFTVDAAPPPVPVLESPRDGLPSREAPSFRARYENPDGTAGLLEIRVCADADCATERGRATTSVAAGESATFEPALAYGTYWWQARALDAAGNASAWTPRRSFSYTAGTVGRGADVPLPEVSAVTLPLLGLTVDPVRCEKNRPLVVRVALRTSARMALRLVEKSDKRSSRWSSVAALRVDLGAGAHTVQLPIRRALDRRLHYKLVVDVASGTGSESRSLAVRFLGTRKASGAAAATCDGTP